MGKIDTTDMSQLRQMFESSVDQYPNHIAIMCDDIVLSYTSLESKANQLAHYLISKGVNEQHSIALLLERSLHCYIAILAILKTGASYVPIEVEYPDERVHDIFSDMDCYAVITSSTQYERHHHIPFPTAIILDEIQADLAQQSTLRPALTPSTDDQLCYVIYTSGSTDKPKGVEITHRNICHYVKVASTIYNMTPSDRVYQGFSLAFDASQEELWMAFANGAALIACTSKDVRSGVGLTDFLTSHQVTVFSTVPTLLATLEHPLPHLRLLILGGEACSPHLIKKWCRPGLQMINTYGPTEATVIATYAICDPSQPVTIGKPLPGYDVVILDESLEPVSPGEAGELCIAGMGLARGYRNRPDITAEKFIQNPANPAQRLYRTGDLARLDNNQNIEFLGRIDSQVKLRGFRIELNEIENVLMQHARIKQAVVALHHIDKPILVAYMVMNEETDINVKELKHYLQTHLPHYMIPEIFEHVHAFPCLASGKVDRKSLPLPKTNAHQTHYVPPTTDLERQIATSWEAVFNQGPISIEDDFFYDLGGHSLTAATIVSQLRKINVLQTLSILDLYQHPTIKQLAAQFQHVTSQKTEPSPPKNHTNRFVYGLCAIGQFFGCLLQYAIEAWQLLAIILCYAWITEYAGFFSVDTLVIFSLILLGIPISSMIITICAKWLLLGRVKPGKYKLWGWFYFRWWLVDRLQNNIFSPHHLIGSPLITLYYRLMGAKIGRNCHIGTSNIGIPDMIQMGHNCAIGFDARLTGYIVEDGWLKIGTIQLGNHCFIGSRSVISINTTMHDGAKLDDMSMLPTAHQIPAEQFYSGSPARQSIASHEHIIHQHKTIDQSSRIKNIIFGGLHYVSLVFAIMLYYLCYLPALLLITYFHEQTHYLLTIFLAAPLGAIIFLCLYFLVVGACKRLLMHKIKPGVYPVKSFYYLRQWTIAKMLDIDEVYSMADTLYFPYLLRFLGAKIGKRVEMGETPHIIPDLITIHDEGFTASAVALAWPSVYQGCIKFAPVEIGKRGFVGNDSLLPLGANIGEGGLLGCMTITPPDNQAANHNTAWLGSPAVFLPKRELFCEYSDTDKFNPPQRLIHLRLAIELIRIIMPPAFTLVALFNMLYVLKNILADSPVTTTIIALPIANLLITLGLVGIVVVLKWLVMGKIKAATKPIWNIFIWKNDVIGNLFHYFVGAHFTHVVQGTPFITMLFRAFGAKVGKRAFINTDDFTEFDLITIGNEVCINTEAVVQTHLYEDRIFKMSSVTVEDGCNIGVASIVLYNTVMEKNATLGNFSLLMKGETLPQKTQWQGIPAQPMKISAEESIPTKPVNTSTTTLILEVE